MMRGGPPAVPLGSGGPNPHGTPAGGGASRQPSHVGNAKVAAGTGQESGRTLAGLLTWRRAKARAGGPGAVRADRGARTRASKNPTSESGRALAALAHPDALSCTPR